MEIINNSFTYIMYNSICNKYGWRIALEMVNKYK